MPFLVFVFSLLLMLVSVATFGLSADGTFGRTSVYAPLLLAAIAILLAGACGIMLVFQGKGTPFLWISLLLSLLSFAINALFLKSILYVA